MKYRLSALIASPICVLFLALASTTPKAGAAQKERLELRYQRVDLPGAPSTILPADLNEDGRQDLVIVVAYTEWDRIGVEESVEMDDIEGLVEVLTVVPSLTDRRELWVFLATESGGFRPLSAPLPLETSVLSLDVGPPGLPIVALTDDGLAALRLIGEGSPTAVELAPVFEERSLLAHSGTFIPDLGLSTDLDGDGHRDLLFPTLAGAALYLSRDRSFPPQPTSRLRWPVEDRSSRNRLTHHYPLPEIRDVNGDHLPDLLLPHGRLEWKQFHVLLNQGQGRFSPPFAPLGIEAEESEAEETEAEGTGSEALNQDEDREPHEDKDGSVVYFGDVDGDGIAEVVTQKDLAEGDGGMRKEMREAKRPPFRYRFYRTRTDLSREAEPYLEHAATGYAFDGDSDVRVPGGFQDLDGDGRQDLITLTLDFSIMQAVRILTTHRISIGLDFHIWCQTEDGRFRAVQGLDLSGKFRLDLDNFRVGELSQFAGDFDADGRADFVQMGRGRDVSIHRGRAACAYPGEPDLRIRLTEEPKDLSLVQVRDLDADGLTDLLVIQPQRVTDPGVTAPVRLDLYLSGDTE